MARARAESVVKDAGGDDAPAPELNRCLVYSRMRPTKPGELDPKAGVYQLVQFHGKGRIMLDEEKTYDFDGTFGQDCVNEDVYLGVGKPTVDHVMKGYTSAILAYGQTGTGKSFTMSNFKPGMEGVIPLSVAYLLQRVEQDTTRTYELQAQFVQIYRDNLSDLMSADSAKVDVRFDAKDGVTLLGCTTTKIETKRDFEEMYSEGDSRRVVRATLMNPESSRGHTALVIHISSQPKEGESGGKRKGKLTFIDLAGYERFSKTGISGDPVCKDEAKTINASLLSLGHVVSALSAGDKHVPWRNSKLTRLLQDSIGGKSRTTILIMLGPSSDHLHETTNSLDFGMRAMAVKVAAKVEENVDFERLAKKLQELLSQAEDKVNKLELAATARQAELADRERRHKRDVEQLRARHKEELHRLLDEGATPDRLQALLKAHEVEDEVLQDQQECERVVMDEALEREQTALVEEVEEEHRQRERSIKHQGAGHAHRVRELEGQLQAALALVAELRGQPLAEVAQEIQQAAAVSPTLDSADEDAASPRTAAGIAHQIDRRELDELRQKLEQSETKAKEQIERMKRAQLKLAEKAKGLQKRLDEQQQPQQGAAEAAAGAADEAALASERARCQKAEKARDGLQDELKAARKELARLQAELQRAIRERDAALAELRALQGDSAERDAEKRAQERRRAEEASRDRERNESSRRQELQRKESALRLQEELERARARAAGRYPYKSALVNRLVDCAQLPGGLPKGAPELKPPAETLAQLDPAEFKAALRYRVHFLGAAGSGKTTALHCLSAAKTPMLKSLPPAEPPTTCMAPTCLEVKQKTQGGWLAKKKKETSTLLELWDTPGGARVISALPRGLLPTRGCCFCVCYSFHKDFDDEARQMAEVLAALVASTGAGADGAVPVVLLGTGKDLVSGDTAAVQEKVGKAVEWFHTLPYARGQLTLLGAYATSAKDWSVLGELGKDGPQSFPQVMRHLSRQLHSMYPSTPPAVLGEDEAYGSGAGYQFEDWWQAQANGGGSTKQQVHLAVVSLAVHLDRMQRRGTWLIGLQELQWLIEEHLGRGVEHSPHLLQRVQHALGTRGLLHTVRDRGAPDGEGIAVLDASVPARLVSALLLPCLSIAQADRWAAARQGALREALTRGGLDQLSRDDWHALYDGRLTPRLAQAALRSAAEPFGRSAALAAEYIVAASLGYELSEDRGSAELFAPCAATRTMSPQMQAAAYQVVHHRGGGTPAAATLDATALPLPAITAALRALHELAGPSAWIWGDAVAGELRGSWFYCKCVPGDRIALCTVRGGPIEKLTAAVSAALDAHGAAAKWAEGMSLDDLPALAPKMSKLVREAPSGAAAFEQMPLSFLRGGALPDALEQELLQRRRGSAARGASGDMATPKAGWTPSPSPIGAAAGSRSSKGRASSKGTSHGLDSKGTSLHADPEESAE
eukprot:TRINITY_DN6140_c0_g3_i1.p1 TRINITY_DN6140_c0_g3~~TRINITY_DN6140_c0_g3_i1.p1  ORF type:complete len:1441 (+),score=497.38 TRINITY_DN6140_c0_g3_i1:186-4508(+)